MGILSITDKILTIRSTQKNQSSISNRVVNPVGVDPDPTLEKKPGSGSDRYKSQYIFGKYQGLVADPDGVDPDPTFQKKKPDSDPTLENTPDPIRF